ncbi:unnamed protein product, partial [Staurois parvus]
MLIKSTNTVLMTLGRKGSTCEAIKGLTVCWLTVCCVFYWGDMLCCISLLCCAERYKAACPCWQERPMFFPNR